MNRRHFLMGSTVAGAALAAAGCSTLQHLHDYMTPVPTPIDPEVDELQQRTFNWFTHVTNRSNGLTPDRWPTPSFSSVAAVGFALTCWPVGVERGWISREEARERTLTTIRFFHDLPQGPEPTGKGGYKGFFYHFLDMNTGHRFGRTELSTVDTALLVAGMLFASRWFDGDHADEAEIRRLAQAVYDRSWTDRWGPLHLHFAPMFGHQYSHMFVDFRGIQDAFMRARGRETGIVGFNYAMNSVRAVEAQRKYAIDNPNGWAGYSADVWGLTACDGPGDFRQTIGGRKREFFSYSARGPGERDDGTIAPTAAIGSFPFAPHQVTQAIKAMKARYGAAIYTEWGFLDSFNPTLTERDGPLQHGRIVPGIGWVDGDYLGIDQGPIVIQIENHRSDIVWKRMRGEPNITRGLKLAGFTGGWLNDA